MLVLWGPLALIPLSMHRVSSAKTLFVLFALVSSLEHARAEPGKAPMHKHKTSKPSYAGHYHMGGTEVMGDLALLQDGTFCFTMVAGGLDHRAAGHWRALADGSGIELKEARAESQELLVRLSESEDPQQVQFEFGGYTMADAPGPVFAVSPTDDAPASLRTLFAQRMSTWRPSYKVALSAQQAKFAYFGVVGHGPTPRLKVSVYALKPGQALRVDYNAAQNVPRVEGHARLDNDTLYLEDMRLRRRGDVERELAAELSEQCIRPMLERAGGATQPELLKPTRTMYLPLERMTQKPWFEK